ncbi:ADP-ribosyltransferase [Catenulispora yoronensis]|uniref:ADP-ribosyltransferase n=1 Tax=Catenulispora yoronensis TaxID=450799 RepID=A0ABN2V2T0_9ACTN
MIKNRVRSLPAFVAVVLSLAIVPQVAAGGAHAAALTPMQMCPVPADHLYGAAERDIPLERIAPVPSWRSNCDEVYRADGRGPEIIFMEGFHPKDVATGQYDLEAYVLKNQASPFVSTSYDHDLYKQWKSGWNYYIDAPGGIDVNATIGYTHRWAGQKEVAYPGGIATRFIVGVCPVDTTTKTEVLAGCVRNPNYVPWRGILGGFPVS